MESQSKQSVQKYFIGFIALAILFIIVGGLYVWQYKQLQTKIANNKALAAKVTSLQTQAKAKTSPYLFAGQVDQADDRADPNNILVDSLAMNPKGSEIVEVWIAYGTNPNLLTLQTTPDSYELALALNDSRYNSLTFAVKKSTLKPDTHYFYRLMAETDKGAILKSETASFTSLK